MHVLELFISFQPGLKDFIFFIENEQFRFVSGGLFLSSEGFAGKEFPDLPVPFSDGQPGRRMQSSAAFQTQDLIRTKQHPQIISAFQRLQAPAADSFIQLS